MAGSMASINTAHAMINEIVMRKFKITYFLDFYLFSALCRFLQDDFLILNKASRLKILTTI